MADYLPLIDAAIKNLTDLRALVLPADTPVITTPGQLDTALAAAVPGAVLTLAPELVYPAPLTLARSVTLRSVTLHMGRQTETGSLPTFTGGITVTGNAVTLIGLEVHHQDPDQYIVVVIGASCTLDACRILGDPVKGAHMGIAANGAGTVIRRCYVDHCFLVGRDAQALSVWDTLGPVTIDDCYLCGAGETVLVGGSDSSFSGPPRGLTLTNSTLTKRQAWRTNGAQVKNAFELKNVIGAIVQHNIFEYCWVDGQVGCLVQLTPRNQDGGNPWATVEDVDIGFNTLRHASGLFNLLGTDDEKPSGRMTNIRIHDNVCEDIDPAVWGGNDKLIQIMSAPSNVQITGNNFSGGKGLACGLYFDGPPCPGMTITGNTFPNGMTYGLVFGTDNQPANQSEVVFKYFCPDGVFTGNT